MIMKDILLTLLKASNKTLNRAKEKKTYECANFTHVLNKMPNYQKLVQELSSVRGYTQDRTERRGSITSMASSALAKLTFGGKDDIEVKEDTYTVGGEDLDIPDIEHIEVKHCAH